MYAQLIKTLSTNLTAGEKKGFSLKKMAKKGFHAIFQLKKRFFLKKAKTFLKGSPGMPVSFQISLSSTIAYLPYW